MLVCAAELVTCNHRADHCQRVRERKVCRTQRSQRCRMVSVRGLECCSIVLVAGCLAKVVTLLEQRSGVWRMNLQRARSLVSPDAHDHHHRRCRCRRHGSPPSPSTSSYSSSSPYPTVHVRATRSNALAGETGVAFLVEAIPALGSESRISRCV
jgi:hypothetical protein